MAIKVEFKGFEELIEKLKDADKDVDKAVEKCVRKSAEIIDDQLRASMNSAGVAPSLIQDINPIRYAREGNSFSAEVGYKKGAYNPKDPSDGYKAIFINYGTPKITPRNFIADTKKKSKNKVKKEQEKILNDILGGLD
jgi:HK97 gp10 family phage protein